VGWRWSQYIVAIIDGVVFVLLFFTFEETMFPRFLFSRTIIHAISAPQAKDKEIGNDTAKDPAKVSSEADLDLRVRSHTSEDRALVPQFPKRPYLQRLKPWTYYPQNRTGFWQYFRRPFFLWGFPNIVIVLNTVTP
jgi:hypothetical protein